MISPLVFSISIFKDNYVWVVVDAKKRAVVIDPGMATPVISFLNQQDLQLAGILLTHHHWDHSDGATELSDTFRVPIYRKVLNPLIIPDFAWSFKVIAIPGHTLDHLAFYTPEVLFCGDTLFSGGCGRVFEGNAKQMYTSLQTLAALPDATLVYCGHEYTLKNLQFAQTVEPHNHDIKNYLHNVEQLRADNLPSLPSSIGLEKKINPFLRCHVAAVIASASEFAGKALHDPVEVFAYLRKWKDAF